MGPVRIAVAAAAIAYSAWHFAYSGVIAPLERPNLRDVGRELVPLQEFVQAGGAEYQAAHNRQYGPVFLFGMLPFARSWGGDAMWLAKALYAIQLIAFGAAFALTWLSLRLYLREQQARHGIAPPSLSVMTLLLAVLWLNFAPAYYVITTKNVETWELALIAMATYASLRRSDAGTAIGVAAAALTKMLPVAYFGMLLVRRPRAAAMTVGAVVIILAAAHVTFGPDAGFRYVSRIVGAASGGAGYGNTQYALTWHENVAIKGMVDKGFGQLRSPYVPTANDTVHRYYVGMSPETARRSAVVGTVLQAVGGLIFLVGLWRGASTPAAPVRTELWCWAWTAAFMMILPPQSAFHYMILTLPAISFVIISAVAETQRWHPRLLLAAAVALLIANILPRTVINRLLLMDVLRAWSSYDYLTLSETYQYFGFPLLGMLLLIAYLWVTRPTRAEPLPA